MRIGTLDGHHHIVLTLDRMSICGMWTSSVEYQRRLPLCRTCRMMAREMHLNLNTVAAKIAEPDINDDLIRTAKLAKRHGMGGLAVMLERLVNPNCRATP